LCLAVPGKVLSKEGTHAKVDFGGGIVRDVNISLVDVEVGQYVVVHAGFAIQVMDEEEAKETLRLWQEIFELEQGGVEAVDV
jgi:hydrogenase expression/formation protein HypC